MSTVNTEGNWFLNCNVRKYVPVAKLDGGAPLGKLATIWWLDVLSAGKLILSSVTAGSLPKF
jgi:hypothetical protein